MSSLTLANLPAPLIWQPAPEEWSLSDAGVLSVRASAQTDMFVSPQGDSVRLNAPRLLAQLDGDFQLIARVTVDFESAFDAGVLLLYAGERSWAKLCFEVSPQRQSMVVSVVTRELSDDANAFDVAGATVWLRVARLGQAFAFHAAADGLRWQFVRHFALGAAGPILAGFEAQSPTGAGCRVQFDQIRYTPQTLGDLRSGE